MMNYVSMSVARRAFVSGRAVFGYDQFGRLISGVQAGSAPAAHILCANMRRRTFMRWVRYDRPVYFAIE